MWQERKEGREKDSGIAGGEWKTVVNKWLDGKELNEEGIRKSGRRNNSS